MKKQRYFFALFAILFIFSAFAFTRLNSGSNKTESAVIPENANAVLQKSCFGCHNSESQNEKSKAALNLTTWEKLSNAQKAGKLKKIIDVVSEGSMPPARFLERFPDKKLKPEETKLLSDWAKSELKNLPK